ncbi:MAG: hypothetical protein ACI8RD_008557, partial [Bacillariaceae sp.]
KLLIHITTLLHYYITNQLTLVPCQTIYFTISFLIIINHAYATVVPGSVDNILFLKHNIMNISYIIQYIITYNV